MSFVVLLAVLLLCGAGLGVFLFLRSRAGQATVVGSKPLEWRLLQPTKLDFEVGPQDMRLGANCITAPVELEGVLAINILRPVQAGPSPTYELARSLPAAPDVAHYEIMSDGAVCAWAPSLPNKLLYYPAAGGQSAPNLIPLGLTSPDLEGLASIVPYGRGVVINFEPAQGKAPHRLASLPKKPSSQDPEHTVPVSLSPLVEDYEGHLEFVGETAAGLLFLTAGRHVAVLKGGVLSTTDIEAPVSLAVSGLRVLAVSERTAQVFDSNLVPIWREELPENAETFVGGKVTADQILLAKAAGSAATLERLTVEPREDGVFGVANRQTVICKPILRLLTNDRGNCLVIEQGGTALLMEPEPLAPFNGRQGTEEAQVINQFRLLSDTIIPKAFSKIAELAKNLF
jgi:hypothetical protein